MSGEAVHSCDEPVTRVELRGSCAWCGTVMRAGLDVTLDNWGSAAVGVVVTLTCSERCREDLERWVEHAAPIRRLRT